MKRSWHVVPWQYTLAEKLENAIGKGDRIVLKVGDEEFEIDWGVVTFSDGSQLARLNSDGLWLGSALRAPMVMADSGLRFLGEEGRTVEA